MTTVSPQGAPASTPSAALLQDVFAVLDAHGYERAPGRILGASLPAFGTLLGDLAATYEGREVLGA